MPVGKLTTSSCLVEVKSSQVQEVNQSSSDWRLALIAPFSALPRCCPALGSPEFGMWPKAAISNSLGRV